MGEVQEELEKHQATFDEQLRLFSESAYDNARGRDLQKLSTEWKDARDAADKFAKKLLKMKSTSEADKAGATKLQEVLTTSSNINVYVFQIETITKLSFSTGASVQFQAAFIQCVHGCSSVQNIRLTLFL